MGCGRAHGASEFWNDHIDVGQRRSGTPSDEQGLSYTHTPLPGACVCLRGTCTDSPETRVHACPAMIITLRRSHSQCVCVCVWHKWVYVQMFVCMDKSESLRASFVPTSCCGPASRSRRSFKESYQWCYKKDFSCIYSDHLFFTHTCPVGRFQTHTPGRTPGQGLQSKGKSKEIVPRMRTEGTRRERADWIENKVKKELLLSIRVTRVEYQKKAEAIKSIDMEADLCVCVYMCVCQRYRESEREGCLCWGWMKERNCVQSQQIAWVWQLQTRGGETILTSLKKGVSSSYSQQICRSWR